MKTGSLSRRQINSSLRKYFKEIYEAGEQQKYIEEFTIDSSEFNDDEFAFNVLVYHSRSDKPARTVMRNW